MLRVFATFTGLVCLTLFAAQGASLRDTPVAPPAAFVRIAETNYCFARVRSLTPERQPPSYLVLKIKMQVAWRNTGTRPLIMPVGHDRTIYTALKPGVMNKFHELPGNGFNPSLTLMKDLPPNVNADNPVDPRNDVFTVIPASGDMMSPLLDEIILPVNHKFLLRKNPDLRGHRVYLRLRLEQQEMTDALLTELSDRWIRFGAPWTGSMLTNVVTIDVPQQIPAAKPCVDGPFETPDNHAPDLGK